jgi:hypothetical protein
MSQVIVVGGGLAGLSAAHTLLERGANVLLLDKQPYVQGFGKGVCIELIRFVIDLWVAILQKPRQVSMEPAQIHRESWAFQIRQRYSLTTLRNQCASVFSCFECHLSVFRLVNSLVTISFESLLVARVMPSTGCRKSSASTFPRFLVWVATVNPVHIVVMPNFLEWCVRILFIGICFFGRVPLH